MELIINGINWLDAHSGFVNAVLVLVLVGATIYYARKTAGIAEATKEQADASVRMAKAMTVTLELSYVPALDIAKSGTLKVTKDGVLIAVVNEGKAKAENIKVECRYAGSLYRGDLPGLLEPGGPRKGKQVYCTRAGTYDHNNYVQFGEQWGSLTVRISGTDVQGRPLAQKEVRITYEELKKWQPDIELPTDKSTLL